jgi:hypothetical protein
MKIKSGALILSAAFLASPLAFSADQAAPAATAPAGGPAANASKSDLQPAGQVVWVSGTVKATYPEQTARILVRGSIIYEKDTLVTDESGSGQISFTDNTMLTLNPKTTFVIEQYYFNQKKPQQGGQSVMTLVKGGFRTVTGFVAKASPANYQLKTPVATIGVRGTDFQGACPNNPGECAYALLHGIGLTLTNATGTYNLTPQAPYASIASYTTSAVISHNPASYMGTPPTISPANSPPAGSSGGSGGNCGILIN